MTARSARTIRNRSWPVVTVFAGIIALQVLVAMLSIDLLSAVRAYVTGESLYSKGQKDAQIYLLDYADLRREEDHGRFLAALAVPLGDRVAREELQKPNPDLAEVRRGFLAGGNHPDDIDGLIRLFQWFHRVPFMADAIATWTAGDAVIDEMRVLVENARARVAAGTFDAPAVHEMRTRALVLNKQLSELESKFSAQLGAASRETKGLLVGLNFLLAVVLSWTGVAFIRQNLRARAAAESELKRRQDSLQRLMDSAAEGLYGADNDGNFTFVNRSALQMFGYARESELVGRNVHELVHHTHADGKHYPHSDCKMYRAYRQREHAHVLDEVFWRQDGTSFPVEYWSHPVVQDGQVHGVVVTFFDISERLRTQSALRESETRLARLVDSVADAVITINANEEIVLFNRAAERLFRVSAMETVGGSIERFFPLRLRGRHHDMIRHFVGGAPDTRLIGGLQEFTAVRADGAEFPIEASLSKLQTDQGLLVTIVLRDVSEQRSIREERQAREALEASNRAKTQFLSRMSHELRTPLNAVLGFSQLLRVDLKRPLHDDQLARVNHIEHAGMHLLALVDDVLDLSRVESGHMTLSLEPVDMGSVADAVIGFVSPLAVAAGVTVSRAPSPSADPSSASNPPGEGQPRSTSDDWPWVHADRVRLQQVLVNLLSNAAKYNCEGGRVTLSHARHGDMCRIVVADTGMGMTDEQLARLYEPFNRLGAERSKIKGTGIGLVLTKHLVELMHGTLTIESRHGQGTIATVELRCADMPSCDSPKMYVPSQHGALDGSLSVLYAEDNEVNVELVKQVAALRPAVNLSIASNGAVALEMARIDPPQLMLVDMHLGDMTGIELARALRRDPALAQIRLVALSADALPEQISAALDKGFEAYLTKPVNFRQLLQVFDRHTLS